MTENGTEIQERIRRRTTPVAGEPGVRVDGRGRRYYSAAWLDEALAADELAAKRVERFDSLEASSPPAWGDEAGNVDVRLAATLAAVAAAALAVVLAWHYLVAGGVLYAAYRHLTRHSRRRRPKSSWSSLGRTAALMFAAWNSRWLKTTVATPAGKPLRVSVPAAAGRDHVDEDGIPY